MMILKAKAVQVLWLALAMTIVYANEFVFKSSQDKQYVPKSKRSKLSKVAKGFFGMLNKSWVKIVENVGKRISRMKTKERRQASDLYSPHRRVKKKLGCNHYVFQAEGDFCESGEDNMTARKVSFDTDSGDL